jgi:hypothetical protein
MYDSLVITCDCEIYCEGPKLYKDSCSFIALITIFTCNCFILVFIWHVTVFLSFTKFVFQVSYGFFHLWRASHFSVFFFFFFKCAVGGRLSLYSFSQLPFIIPLSSTPTNSINYTSPPSVKDFTSYGPNQFILSFPGC